MLAGAAEQVAEGAAGAVPLAHQAAAVQRPGWALAGLHFFWPCCCGEQQRCTAAPLACALGQALCQACWAQALAPGSAHSCCCCLQLALLLRAALWATWEALPAGPEQQLPALQGCCSGAEAGAASALGAALLQLEL